MRRVAEEVRAPWRVGGPVDAGTTEQVAQTAPGPYACGSTTRACSSRPRALVYLHGGGWTLFSLDTHDRVMREYAARAGVIVVGVDYALSPEARFPVALEQVVGVVRWLRANGAALGVDAIESRSAATPPAATSRSAQRWRCGMPARRDYVSGSAADVPRV